MTGESLVRKDAFLKMLRFQICPVTGLYEIGFISKVILPPDVLTYSEQQLVEYVMSEGHECRLICTDFWTEFIKNARKLTADREN